jgi:nitroimidazol reductase NimA-like FMN-containing flavoprotein (pyridoxamine 5'-phosphate oxidase superfamily)
MRQSKKEIKDVQVIIALLHASPVGRLGTVGKDGRPMVKPLNFVYHDGKIYFHTAREGEKIDDIKRDGRVCFEVDLPIAFVRGQPDNPCGAEYLYRSVIAQGRASLVENREERLAALSALMKKYQPEGGYGEFVPEKLALTGVVRIDIEEMTGKEDLGKDHHREVVLRTLQEGAALPVFLDP